MLRKLLVGIALAATAAAPLLAAESESKKPEPREATAAPRTNWGFGFRVGYLRGDDVARRPVGYDDPNDQLADRPALKARRRWAGGFPL